MSSMQSLFCCSNYSQLFSVCLIHCYEYLIVTCAYRALHSIYMVCSYMRYTIYWVWALAWLAFAEWSCVGFVVATCWFIS